MVVAAKKVVYYIQQDGTIAWTYDMKNGTYGDVQISSDGKYVSVAQGKDAVYLFDGEYRKGSSTGRPFRIMQDDRPRYMAGSASGAFVAFSPYGLTAKDVEPGVLVEQDSIPVYYKDAPLDLDVWTTNPGAERTGLKLRVALSLPQFNWWNAYSQQARVRNEDPAARSKLMDAANYTMPGYREVHDANVTIDKHDSQSIDLSSLTVPDLLEPQWVSDLRALLEDLSPYTEFLADALPPLEDLLESDEYQQIAGKVDEEHQGNSSYFPLLGLGTAELYNPDTNVIIDQGSFYFIYLSETDSM